MESVGVSSEIDFVDSIPDTVGYSDDFEAESALTSYSISKCSTVDM